MTGDLRESRLDRLYESFTKLRTKEEAASFLSDLCTFREVEDMAQRLAAAGMLKQGENYMKIASEIGISTATISRVSRCLNYGSGGYRAVLEKLKEGDKA